MDAARAGWTVRSWDVLMGLRPTDSGQVGLFPEHADRLADLAGAVADRGDTSSSPVEVLNLFAYTGLATLAMAGWGAAVTHVDAARPSVAWARENAAANGLTERPIRWIVEDARAYVRREVRRGRRYAGIVLDPPSYGHAGGGSAWQLEADLPGLLDGCAALLEDDGFVLLTAHTDGYSPARLGKTLTASLGDPPGAPPTSGAVELLATSGARLDLGAWAFLDRRS